MKNIENIAQSGPIMKNYHFVESNDLSVAYVGGSLHNDNYGNHIINIAGKGWMVYSDFSILHNSFDSNRTWSSLMYENPKSREWYVALNIAAKAQHDEDWWPASQTLWKNVKGYESKTFLATAGWFVRSHLRFHAEISDINEEFDYYSFRRTEPVYYAPQTLGDDIGYNIGEDYRFFRHYFRLIVYRQII
jgi:hypothetical protein